MRVGHALIALQRKKRGGIIASGIDLLHSQHRGDERHAPGVDVKHRRHRHVHVTACDILSDRLVCDRRGGRQGMQNKLSMREEHLLGVTGRSGRVERRRDGVLIEIVKGEAGVARFDQGLEAVTCHSAEGDDA